AAQAQLSGGLGQRIEAARAEVLEIVAHVEAWIDFPEEDIDPVTGALLQEKIAVVRSRIDGLLATADRGRILREGLRTVICGAPNVGKSSLLNRLLGYDRAIVSDVAGTTRDTIEEIINLRGIPLRLIDTAGLRESDDVLEQAGMARTLRQLDQAELVIHVVDASLPRGAGSDAPQVMAGTQVLTVLNKADLGRHLDWEAVSGFPFSCATGEGEDALVEAIFRLTGQTQAQWEGECVAISVRHRDALRRAGEGLDAVAALLEANAAGELAALELREALDALGEIVGRLDIEDILGEIFGRFCIGK
ncbi:MAG TPA: 50S ribosome-binding GTPase, partial [Verrucomicrobiales bacterium]|nr:50S ribosome-binding GTPase [Verrucomicrobiales bacterium]